MVVHGSQASGDKVTSQDGNSRQRLARSLSDAKVDIRQGCAVDSRAVGLEAATW